MALELGEHRLVNHFKRELQAMQFLSQDDRQSIEQWIGIIADPRKKWHERAESAKSFWRLFVRKSLRQNTDNLRGYEQLCQYLEDYVEYEDLFFAVDIRHRDHLVHSIWVMLLGIFLKSKFTALSNIQCFLPNLGREGEEHQLVQDKIDEVLETLKEREYSLWCLIALTHDLGYPVEKTKMANSSMAKMIGHYGFLEQRDFEYDFTVVHQTSIEQLLDIVSSCIAWNPSGGYKVITNTGARLDAAKSFERLDHGIMSAYLLLRYLDFFCEICNVPQGAPELSNYSIAKASDYTAATTLLRAISQHTNCNQYWAELNDFGVLLFLCDELEEFSRYTLVDKEWTNVRCRTYFGCTEHLIDIRYVFDNTDVSDDMESFFRDKVGAIRDRLDVIADKVKKITLSCRDVRQPDPLVLKYERKLSDDTPETIRRAPGKKTYDVVDYLRCDVDLAPD